MGRVHLFSGLSGIIPHGYFLLECRKCWGFSPEQTLKDVCDSGSYELCTHRCMRSMCIVGFHFAWCLCIFLFFSYLGKGHWIMAVSLSSDYQWQKWSRIYLQCRRTLPEGLVRICTGYPQLPLIAKWAKVILHLIELFLQKKPKTTQTKDTFGFALKFVNLFCVMLNICFCFQTGKVWW